MENRTIHQHNIQCCMFRIFNSPPPPSKIFRFFLKSEGKEVERNKKRKGCDGEGGGGYMLTYFLRVEIFQGSLRNFLGGGVDKFSGGGVDKFLGG